MVSVPLLQGPSVMPKSGKVKQLVIFLHGYGSNGADLISIAPEWASELPDAVFLSPNAPDVCEAWASGFQWFPIRAADGLATKVLDRAEMVQKPATALNAYIDAQLAQWQVAEDQLAVVGFSQGAMMAMYTMPRRQKPCAAVVGYSGMLLDAGGLKAANVVKPPILAIHGDADEVVLPSCLKDIETGFSAAGFNVETVMRPYLAHGIDAFGLARGVSFIKKAFEK